MWIIHPVFIITLCMFLVTVLAGSHTEEPLTERDCKYLHPLMYSIICFLAAVVLILLILLFKMFISMQSAIRRDNIHITSDTREPTALCQNNASVSPTSGNGADNSSSTSSGSPEGSLSDLSTTSQRYVSLEDRRKTSDYINVSETASLGLVDFKKKDIDYVNVKESQQKNMKRKGQVSCDDGTTSFSSDDSAVNYSKVVFTKAEK